MRPASVIVRCLLAVAFLCASTYETQRATALLSTAATTPSIDWASYNGSPNATRFSPAAQISKRSVRGLHVVCSADLGRFARFETGPVEVGGVIYATTSADTFAIDASTCRILWTNVYVPVTPGSEANRGVAYSNGTLFRGFSDGHVVAIRAADGRTVWNRSIVAAGSAEYVSGAPIVWNDTVIAGTANGDDALVCHVAALDSASGAIVWERATIPSSGEPAASTWRGARHLAGGATWTSFTVDSTTGLVYVPVGNPGPDFDRRMRRGANLFTNSILEIDPANGALRRGVQLVRDDDHDWDQAAAPVIVPAAAGRKMLVTAGKDGYLRGFDFETFGQLWQTPVTTISNTVAPITLAGTHFCPGGAVFWNGPSFSPRTGLTYVNSVDWCKTVALSATPQPFVPGEPWLGSSDGYGIHDATKSGWLTAVDPSTGDVRWRYHSPTPMLSGVTSTAGGIVFSADLDGNLLAFDDATGELLTSVALEAAVGGGIISYTASGRQFIAVAAGLSSPLFETPQTETSIVVLGL